MKVIAVDFDGTITNGGEWNEESNPMEPNHAMKQHLIKEFDGTKGAFIVVYTARPHIHHEFLRRWLTKYGIPFNAIVCGKVRADVYIDDKAINAREIQG